jgi:hypothetical protein
LDLNSQISVELLTNSIIAGSSDKTLMSREKLLAPGHRLQAFERQALGVRDAGQIEPADEGSDLFAITIGQRHHGIDRNSLGVHRFLAQSGISTCPE